MMKLEYEGSIYRAAMAKRFDTALGVALREIKDMWKYHYPYEDLKYPLEFDFLYLDLTFSSDAANVDEFRTKLDWAHSMTLESFAQKMKKYESWSDSRWRESEQMLKYMYEIRIKASDFYFSTI